MKEEEKTASQEKKAPQEASSQPQATQEQPEEQPQEQPEDQPQEKEILVFSPRLRHDIRIACRQLDGSQGQEDTTIDKEVQTWLSK